MPNRKWVLTSLLVIAITVIAFKAMGLTGWGKTVLFPASRTGREMLAPAQKGISAVSTGIRDFFTYFKEKQLLNKDNEEMTRKIAQLEDQIHELKEQEQENQRLRDLLEYRGEKEKNYQLSMAKVIGRDPSNWYRTIIIDLGTSKGIKTGMPVVTHVGLVGSIINVTSNTAEVLLILDSEAAVGGRIFDNRIPGVVLGLGKSDLLEMIHIPHDTPLEANQEVVTSGLGGIFPRGIRIGTIFDIEKDPNGLMKKAKIKPFVDFTRLEEVFVIEYVKTPEEDSAGTVEAVPSAQG